MVPQEIRMHLQSLVSINTLLYSLSLYSTTSFPDSDTMPCCDICKGLCFFFYLPFLPLWWTLDFLWEFGRRKWRRSKRKKRYRALKASQAENAKGQYLSVDQYTRGKVEKQILGVNNKIKKSRNKNKGVLSYSLWSNRGACGSLL